ncbi:hypothetical protein SADUNF_Sadunf15G0075700 [Salix dunnii]|uniref:Uncharacterized protein n=1 Tax=Salix dunnii TaxID=1413687 RepID=A0A835JG84_9ROSI|nr:hypothetical protein SADUNF_Sadunf15G0075700 [Salix dunnii]
MLEVQAIILHPYSLACLLFIFVTKWFFFNSARNKNLPPSPLKIPVVGNLLQLGLYPHRFLHSLAKRHGPLMLLHLGSAPTLVVSSADGAREIMRTHDVIFSNRPDSSIARRLLYDYKDLSLAPYGEYWRQMRSICVVQLLSSKRVKLFQSIREEETALLVQNVELFSSRSLQVDLSELFSELTNDVVCRISFGKKYREGDGGRKFKKLLEEFGAVLGVFNVGDFIPWLGWINYLTGLNARVEWVFKEFDRFLDEVIEEFQAKRVVLNEDKMNFVDVLLEIQKISTDGVSIGRDSIKAIILDMFSAGTDTIHTALEWTMTELLKHPEVMKKAQDEIRRIVGSKNTVTRDDVEKTLYLKAVIKESLRLHPPIPMLVPRESTEDVKVQGYDILAKTRVIINFWAIGRDPSSWEKPEEFRPERFLESAIDFKGNDFQFIPFGAGRRGCPGAAFASSLIEITLASLLHKFNWALPGGAKPEDLDVTEAPGLAIHRKFPLVVIATPHSF